MGQYPQSKFEYKQLVFCFKEHKMIKTNIRKKLPREEYDFAI